MSTTSLGVPLTIFSRPTLKLVCSSRLSLSPSYDEPVLLFVNLARRVVISLSRVLPRRCGKSVAPKAVSDAGI